MVRIILEPYGDLIEVVAEASDGESAIDQAVLHKVDLVLMDVNLLSPNGVETTRRLKQAMPQVVILGLSADYTPQIYNSMIAAGAVAFVRKQDAADMLFRTIVYAMFHYCRPQDQDQVVGSAAPGRSEEGTQTSLLVSAPTASLLPSF
jgi:DNA-binding NarL/FixJ family response regulator